MPKKLASWLRPKDEKFFNPVFARYAAVTIENAFSSDVNMGEVDGLLLTGGGDVAPEFLNQPVPDPAIIHPEPDNRRDPWEIAAIKSAIGREIPILAICKGMQTLNVALGGTLILDLPGHNLPEQKDNDVQPLRIDRAAKHRMAEVNSSHHQAVDRPAGGFVIEAWCASDDIIEQMRLEDYPFALAVQYHPERGAIYDALFDDFFAHVLQR